MKIGRIGKTFLVAVVLLAAGVAALFVPMVQKAVFLAVVAGDGREVAVSRFSAGAGGVRATGLEFRQDGFLLRVPDLKVEVRWLSLLSGSLDVLDVTAHGLTVSLPAGAGGDDAVESGRPPSADEPVLPRDFQGLLSWRLPVSVGKVSINGVVSHPEQGEGDFEAGFSDWKPGATGEARITFEPADSAKDHLPVLRTVFSIPFDGEGRPEMASLSATVVSRVEGAKGELVVEGRASRGETGDETYVLTLSSKAFFENGNVGLEGQWRAEPTVLDLSLGASAPDLDFLVPFAGQPLPGISFEADGSMSLVAGKPVESIRLSVHSDVPSGTVPGIAERLTATANLEVSPDGSAGPELRDAHLRVGPSGEVEADSWIHASLVRPLPMTALSAEQVPQGVFGSLRLALPGEVAEVFVSGWRFSELNGAWELAGDDGLLELRPSGDWTLGFAADEGSGWATAVFSPGARVDAEGARIRFAGTLSDEGSEFDFDTDVTWKRGSPDRAVVEADLSGELAALQALLPAESDSIRLAGKVDASLRSEVGDGIRLAGRVSVSDPGLPSLSSGNLEIEIGEVHFLPGDPASLDGVFSGVWRANDAAASVDIRRVRLEAPPGGRLRIVRAVAGLKIDRGAFSSADGSDGVEAGTGSGPSETTAFPGPGAFAFLREGPVLPLDLAEVKVEAEISTGPRHPEPTTFNLAITDWIAGEEDGTFSLEVSMDREDGAPVQIEGGMSLGDDGRVRRADLSGDIPVSILAAELPGAFLRAAYRPGVQSQALTLSVDGPGGGPRLLDVSATAQDQGGALVLESDLSAFRRSDWGRFVPNLSGGRLRVDVEVVEEKISGQWDLVAGAPLDSLRSYDWTGGVDLRSLEPLNLKGGTRLTDGSNKVSDASIVISERDQGGYSVHVEGDRADLEAWQGFASIWRGVGDGEASRTDGAGESGGKSFPGDDLPELDGSVAFGEILLPGFPSWKNVDAAFTIRREDLSGRVFAEWMGDADLTAEMRVAREGGGVTGSTRGRLERVPLGPLLREMQSGSPSLEGLFDLGWEFSGSAADPGDLPGKLVGSLSLEGRDGLIRSLKPGERVTRIVEVGSIAGIVLSDKLNRPGVAALGEVALLFREVPFSTLDLNLKRTEEGATEIPTARLRGPYLSLDGRGRIEPSDLESITETPMRVEVTLGAKEPLSPPLRVLGLLGEQTNAAGYRSWKSAVELTGTLADPDPGKLWEMVLGAVERAARLKPKDLEKERETDSSNGGEAKKAEELIEEGLDRLFNIMGG